MSASMRFCYTPGACISDSRHHMCFVGGNCRMRKPIWLAGSYALAGPWRRSSFVSVQARPFGLQDFLCVCRICAFIVHLYQ
jgi:hypothetical protein